MIEILNAVYPSPENWDAVIRGMRSPFKSYDRMDSKVDYDSYRRSYFVMGKNDLKLAKNLISGLSPDNKFLRQLPVTFEICAPLYWWKQMDQYKVGTVTDSESTMHTMVKEPFTEYDFSIDYLEKAREKGEWSEENILMKEPEHTLCIKYITDTLNALRDKYNGTKDMIYWYAINELLPQSYMQTRTWSANYSILFAICQQRAGHTLHEWSDFIRMIVDSVPFFRELCFDTLCDASSAFKGMFDEV